MTTASTFLWFDGKAEEAARFYTSVVPDSRIDAILRYTLETPGGKPGDVMVVEFTLAGHRCIALNGGPYQTFTPAISLFLTVDCQAEIDRLWDALISDGGAPGQCGWLTDRYGLSWQIVPRQLMEMLRDRDTARVARVTRAMLDMTKFDLAALVAAYEGQGAAEG